jgi:prepilin-type N-terminal cleavage/methylation domain-containing protein
MPRFLQNSRGFTLIEVLVVMGLVAILASFSVVNLIKPQTTASLDGVSATLVVDIKSQQNKAMSGSALSAGSAQAHGIYIQPTSYTLFKGASYSAGDVDNFVISMESDTSLSTTFGSSQIVFSQLSGEVSSFVNGSNTITVNNLNGGGSKTLSLNPFGAITVN